MYRNNYLWVQTVLLFSPTSSFNLYAADFIHGLLKKNEKKVSRSFNFKFNYINDVLSINNSKFGDFIDRIYPIALEITDTTDTVISASYLDLHLEIDSECRLRTKLYDKREYFSFSIVPIYILVKLKSSLRRSYGRHLDLVNR
jgi:hypothetical protein